MQYELSTSRFGGFLGVLAIAALGYAITGIPRLWKRHNSLVVRMMFVISASVGAIIFAIIVLFVSYSPPYQMQPLTGDAKEEALSYVSFQYPTGWEIISPGWASIVTSQLMVFVFDLEQGTNIEAVDSILQVVSEGSIIEKQYYDDEYLVDGAPSYVVWVDGSMLKHDGNNALLDTIKREPGNPFKGFYVAFTHKKWIYVFAWDAFDPQTQKSLNDIALTTLQSIHRLEAPQIATPEATKDIFVSPAEVLLPTRIWATATPKPRRTELPTNIKVLPPASATVLENDVNLRENPSLEAGIVGHVPQGNVLTVFNRTDDRNWLRACCADKRMGWVRTKLVSLSVPVEKLPIYTSGSK